MLKNEREIQIIDLLNEKGYASVADLSKMLFASQSSIRRDLTNLEKKGMVRRSYGGAELINSKSNILPFSTRAYSCVLEKEQIAKKAATLVKDGDVVFLDQSSTCYFLAGELVNKKGITVVTNSLNTLNLLSLTDLKVISTGGVLSREDRSCLVGEGAEKTYDGIFADIAFFATKSLSADGVISDCTQEEIAVRKIMLKNSAKKVYLCNSAKFDTKSPYIQCTLSDIDILISENNSEKYEKYCEVY